MPRSSANIQAEIDRLETFLSGADTTLASTSADGTAMANASRAELAKRLDSLYVQLGRANGTSPMFVRGEVTGLRGRN